MKVLGKLQTALKINFSAKERAFFGMPGSRVVFLYFHGQNKYKIWVLVLIASRLKSEKTVNFGFKIYFLGSK